jgi:hypothetical protein
VSELDPGSVGVVICDPPYGIDFLGKDWDRVRDLQEWHTSWLAEVFRALEPGRTVKAFGATRTFHRLAAAMVDVGFVDIRLEAWGYGSGFPKGADIGKAIDREAGVREYFDTVRDHIRTWRDRRGMSNRDLNIAVGSSLTGSGMARHWTSNSGTQHSIPSKAQWAKLKELLAWPDCELDQVYDYVKDGATRPGTGEFRRGVSGMFANLLGKKSEQVVYEVTSSATPDAELWEGWGTALRASWEPVLVGRKPVGTVSPPSPLGSPS